MVLTAARGEEGRRRDALAALCRAYWKPVYAYARRRGHDLEDSRDLTQEFFHRLLEKDWLASLRQEGGKFRTFLLTLAQRFMADQYDRRTALKRGGGVRDISFDWDEGESVANRIASTEESPEAAFDRLWAMQIITRAVSRLREEMAAGGKAVLWPHLEPLLSTEPTQGECARIGAATGLTANYVSVMLHRWRRRVRALVLEEIQDTVTNPAAAKEEFQNLIDALRGSGG